MKVFLSHQFEDDISEIIALLKNENIEVFDSMTDIEYGGSLQKAIKKSITDCDFVLLIYTSPNPNIAFEAGVAASINKPIFSIISDKESPDFLFDSTCVYATPTETEKVRFNLKIFLEKVRSVKKTISVKKAKYYGGSYVNYYKNILYDYKHLNKKSERDYELFFKQIFNLYELSVVQNKFDSKENFYSDFCIWSDKLSHVIGNPILIEVKTEITVAIIKGIVEKFIENKSAESCLVFYDHLKGIDKKDLPNSSKCLFIQTSDFISKLNDNDFNDSIRKIRNEIVHFKH